MPDCNFLYPIYLSILTVLSFIYYAIHISWDAKLDLSKFLHHTGSFATHLLPAQTEYVLAMNAGR